jgi:hypothetical protein
MGVHDMAHEFGRADGEAARDEFVLLRWRRHGKDRLYVARSDGTKIGYWDLLTDEAHPETPELAGLLAAAVSTSTWPVPGAFAPDDTVEAAVWRP